MFPNSLKRVSWNGYTFALSVFAAMLLNSDWSKKSVIAYGKNRKIGSTHRALCLRNTFWFKWRGHLLPGI